MHEAKTIFLLAITYVIGVLLPASTAKAHDDYPLTWEPRHPISDEMMIAQEHQYAQDVSDTLDIPLELYETQFFMFYTNISEDDATKWQQALDPIYHRLIALLNLPRSFNIWKGKASIYLFKTKKQFTAFEKEYYNNDITFEAALCHQHYTGEVRLALYQMNDPLFLRQLFIHETMHGIIHRFQTPKRIPTWLNEGIAEWAARKLLGEAPSFRIKSKLSRKFLHKTGYLPADFFSDYRFKPEFYGTALSFTQTLANIDQDTFLNFLSLIKSRTSWQKALKIAYKITPEKLIDDYAKDIGLTELPIEIPTVASTKSNNNKTPQAASSPR